MMTQLQLPEPVATVQAAVEALVGSGDVAAATTIMARVDEAALETERQAANAATRGLPTDSSRPSHSIPRHEALRVHARNRFTCRYSRCGYTLTIDEDVLKVLGRLGVFSYYRSHPRGWHQLAWTYQAAPEHVVPRSPRPEDWTTACWTCNAAKRNIPLEALGWHYDPDPPSHRWQGLREHLPALESLDGQRAGQRGRGRSSGPAGRARATRSAVPQQSRSSGAGEGAALVSRGEALRRHHEGSWRVRSFHATCDSPPDGALVVAARLDDTPQNLKTSRQAWKAYNVERSGPYVSQDGRWRTRQVDSPAELLDAEGWSPRRPWVLERFERPAAG